MEMNKLFGMALGLATTTPSRRAALVAMRGVPENNRVDNGPEFISSALDAWPCQQLVSLQFSRPGKPTENEHVELQRKLRDECLNTNWFTDIFDAREKIELWRKDYNEARPHSALGYSTHFEYINQLANVA
jgi:putative transposase